MVVRSVPAHGCEVEDGLPVLGTGIVRQAFSDVGLGVRLRHHLGAVVPVCYEGRMTLVVNISDWLNGDDIPEGPPHLPAGDRPGVLAAHPPDQPRRLLSVTVEPAAALHLGAQLRLRVLGAGAGGPLTG